MAKSESKGAVGGRRNVVSGFWVNSATLAALEPSVTCNKREVKKVERREGAKIPPDSADCSGGRDGSGPELWPFCVELRERILRGVPAMLKVPQIPRWKGPKGEGAGSSRDDGRAGQTISEDPKKPAGWNFRERPVLASTLDLNQGWREKAQEILRIPFYPPSSSSNQRLIVSSPRDWNASRALG